MLSALLIAPAVLAQPDRRATPTRVLIDRSLRATTVRLVSIGSGAVLFLRPDEPPTAPLTSVPISSVLAIMAPVDEQVKFRRSPALIDDHSGSPPVRLVLTDGQRILGRLTDTSSDQARAENKASTPPTPNDHVVLQASGLGDASISLPLDRIARVEVLSEPPSTLIPGDGTAGPNGADAGNIDDTVTLANGDAVHGFVESLGEEVVIGGKSGVPEQRFPLDHVARVTIANPATRPSGARVWLADGSVLAIAPGALASPDLLLGEAAIGGRFNAKLSDIIGVLFRAEDVEPLAECRVVSVHASPERAWTRAPRVPDGVVPLNAANIEIPGPMSVEWALPQNAARFAGTIELARSTQRWGDCVVTIEEIAAPAAPKRLFNQRLNYATSSAWADISLSNGAGEHRLRITVEAGENGPIQDRVLLVRPLLLIEPARAK